MAQPNILIGFANHLTKLVKRKSAIRRLEGGLIPPQHQEPGPRLSARASSRSSHAGPRSRRTCREAFRFTAQRGNRRQFNESTAKLNRRGNWCRFNQSRGNWCQFNESTLTFGSGVRCEVSGIRREWQERPTHPSIARPWCWAVQASGSLPSGLALAPGSDRESASSSPRGLRLDALVILSWPRDPPRRTARELVVVLSGTLCSPNSNAWPAIRRQARPRHILRRTTLRVRRVPSPVGVRACRRPRRLTEANG